MATFNDYASGINSMSEEIMNSLKNSEGKIPDLANQLIMTNDENSENYYKAGNGIVIEDGVISSKIDFDLLWVNNAPLNEFAPQTVTLYLTDYDYVMIYATLDNAIKHDSRTKVTSMAKVGTTKNLIFGARTADYIRGLRDYDVTEAGIYFGTSNLIHNNGTTGLNNTWCTPIEIYGIKYQESKL